MKYLYVPDAHSKKSLPWYQAINPFVLFLGNFEDGWFGDARWNPERKTDLGTALKWFIRNPLHNLDFHGIGFSDSPVEVYGTEPSEFTNQSGEGWLFHVIRPTETSLQRFILGVLYLVLGSSADVSLLYWIGLLMVNASAPLIPFPFISYTSRTGIISDFYIGWRPYGSFGIKLHMNVDKIKSLLGQK